MKTIRIDMDLNLNLHGKVSIDEWTVANCPEHIHELIVERLSRQFRDAMRDHIAKQMGAKCVTPADLCEIRDLVWESFEAGTLDSHVLIGKAYAKLRRLTA